MSRPVPFEFTPLPGLDEAEPPKIAGLTPARPGVFRIFDVQGSLILLDQTSNLAERIQRYFTDAHARRALDLRGIAGRVEYCRTDSPFETAYLLHREQRRWFPDAYDRMSPFPRFHLLKINRRQRFPRLYPARRIKSGVAYYGPFKSRPELERCKTALERAFRLRPCEYNIRGADPRPDCMYFQMHTCSRPCNGDIGRERYLEDVDAAVAFLEGRDGALTATLLDRVRALAEETRFEEAEQIRRKVERIRKARGEHAARYYDVRTFDFVVVMPADAAARRKLAVVRAGAIEAFEEHPRDGLAETLGATLDRVRAQGGGAAADERRYDEFCLAATFLLHPVKTVRMIPFTNAGETVPAVVRAARPRPAEAT